MRPLVGETDTLTADGDRVVIVSPRAMPDWQIVRYCPIAVHLEGRRYRLVEALPAPPGFRYVLEPWPVFVGDYPTREILYDDDYVEEREARAAFARKWRWLSWALYPAALLAGFLPRPTKARLHERWGVEPVTATRRSILIESAAFGVLLVLVLVHVATGLDWLRMSAPEGADPASVVRDVVLVAVVGTDLAMRGSLMFEESSEAYGFCEWLAHPDLREYGRRLWRAFQEWRGRRA
jgi:hypothetical protein